MIATNPSFSSDPLEETSDEQLVFLAQNGGLDAFDEIVRRHQAYLWSFLFKFCPHQSELEDLVQSVFIKAYQNLDKWRPNGKFKNWLLRVAVNTGYDYYRRRKNEPISIAQRSTSDSEPDPLEGLLAGGDNQSEHPNADLIERLLLELQPEARLVVTLHYYEGFSLAEISSQMSWSLSKTKVKIHRARKKLETTLSEHGLGVGSRNSL